MSRARYFESSRRKSEVAKGHNEGRGIPRAGCLDETGDTLNREDDGRKGGKGIVISRVEQTRKRRCLKSDEGSRRMTDYK